MVKTTKTLNPLPFQDLEPHRFEDLVRQIIYDFKHWRSLEPTGRLGSDDGYDARGLEITDERDELEDEETDDEESSPVSTDRLWQIQCKREKSITPAKLEKYVDEMLKNSNPVPYGVIFAAPCDFSKKTRDTFTKKMRSKKVQEFFLWGRADLEDMLMQPKNDHLLYAYFGISLVIRRRSLKTQIRGLLATKRKAVRHLGGIEENSYREVLLRDANDTQYPYKGEVKDFKKSPPWKKYYFVGHYHEGIEILIVKFYAYREIDNNTGKLKSWDYTEEVNLAAPHDDPWDDDRKKDNDKYYRGYNFWSTKVDKSNQSYFEYVRRIPYERILEIDPLGDTIAKCSHIFIERKDGSFFEKYGEAFLTGAERWMHTHYLQNEDSKNRKKFFPKKFPKVEKKPLPSVGSTDKEKKDEANSRIKNPEDEGV